jgi:hypothetical protein
MILKLMCIWLVFIQYCHILYASSRVPTALPAGRQSFGLFIHLTLSWFVSGYSVGWHAEL